MWGGDGTDDDPDESRRKSIEMALAQHSAGIPTPYDHDEDEDEAEDSDEESDDDAGTGTAGASGGARGKPEAMAARLASTVRVQEIMDELEAEKDDDEADVVAEEIDEEDDDPLDVTMQTVDTVATIDTTVMPKKDKTKSTLPPKKKSAKKMSTTPKNTIASSLPDSPHPTMDDPTKPITNEEYDNLEDLMVQFCRVPLLAEFSRPVALLHPELMTAYTKIVEHPVDLGLVCRKVRKRQYQSLRDVQLDAWRIFSNCVRYHSHQSNKEAVPSFVSIALHLRNYFNALWQEYMIPSDPPTKSSTTSSFKAKGSSSSGSSTISKNGADAALKAAFSKRQSDRKMRVIVSGLSYMSGRCLAQSAETLGNFIKSGGCVDKLDTEPIFGPDVNENDEDVDLVIHNLKTLRKHLKELSVSGAEYGFDALESAITKCYTEDVLEDNPGLRIRIGHRLDRWIGKIIVPVYEASCRGVSQSSVWGCMATTVWARESSKKPFWPALVLGMLAPEHQSEIWHGELTRRNESRLPEKLKTQLVMGKRKAELSLKKQKLGQAEKQSYFLVEFLGTHEFIWIREGDIIEEFDPAEDPNLQDTKHSNIPGSKKRKSGRGNIANIIGSKTYINAIEEAQWALEEFENQFEGVGSSAPIDEDEGYSYAVLCQSDDEADEIDVKSNVAVNLEELNELLATDGIIDFTTSGRKNAKMRAQAIKKQKLDQEKKLKADKLKKVKAEQNKKKRDAQVKDRESKKELKDLDRKRKKRARERDRALKSTDPSAKKRKLEPEDLKKTASGRRILIASKRERANAIVEGYLNRTIKKGDYQSLCLGGVMNIPAAVIDSTGLLGLAMAFRAAAGELPMPEESGVQSCNTKPWDAIKIESKKLSSERLELLEKQAGLLVNEIARLKAATAMRKELAEEAHVEFLEMEAKVEAGDKAARDNPLKKTKTPLKGKGKSPGFKSPKTPSSTAFSEADAESTHDGESASNEGDDPARAYTESSGDEAMNDESFEDMRAEDVEEAVVAVAVDD